LIKKKVFLGQKNLNANNNKNYELLGHILESESFENLSFDKHDRDDYGNPLKLIGDDIII
jgi:hypothetical protein